jgi:hypothetical protein
MVPLAQRGNFIHVYDFRIKAGHGEEFIKLFDEFDYSDTNPMHKSPAQAKDGVLCRDTNDPDHFYLLGEWKDVNEHRQILKVLQGLHPKFVQLIEGGPANFKPLYVEVVSSTPQHLLDKASAAE